MASSIESTATSPGEVADTNPTLLAQAVSALRRGELVAFATETVYGLGADAESQDAVRKIYQLKGRPAGHPLIVHISGLQAAKWWAEINAAGIVLAGAFWPGPLTLIAPRQARAPDFACGTQRTVGLRAPSHPLARDLLRAFEAAGGHGVAAPSANRFGAVSPTTAAHVVDDLGDKLLVLDGGPCVHGLESTIVDVSANPPRLLRPGAILAADINAVLTSEGLAPLQSADDARISAELPQVSGSLAAHYAPHTSLELLACDDIAARAAALSARGVTVAVCAASKPGCPVSHFEAMSADGAAYGQRLYAMLRAFDALGVQRLLLEIPPHTPEWAPVHDRLRRAAKGSGRKRTGQSRR